MLDSGARFAKTSMPNGFGNIRCRIGEFGAFMLCAALGPWFALPMRAVLHCQTAPPNAEKATVPLDSSETREFRLDPGEHEKFVFRAEARTAVNISFEQTREMLSVAWSNGGTAHVPRTNDTGLRSVIRFSIVSGEKTEHVFEVSCLHSRLACAAIVTVSATQPALDADAKIALQEETLAEGEDVRRHGNETTWPVALEKFRASAEFFRVSGDGTRRRAALNGEARLLLYKLSDYRAANDAAVESTTVDTGDSDLQGQGLACKTLASAEYFLGDYDASIRAGEKAIAFYKQTDDDYWQGILLGNAPSK